MSDARSRRSLDDLSIRAALVFPDDPAPALGPNAVRIPVRIVWRDVDAPIGRAADSHSPNILAAGATAPTSSGESGGEITTPARVSEPAAAAPPTPPSFDWVGAVVRVLEATDRISGGGTQWASSNAESAPSKSSLQDPFAPMPVIDDRGVQIIGARGPMVRPANLDPQIFIKQGLADRESLHRIFNSDTKNALVDAIIQPYAPETAAAETAKAVVHEGAVLGRFRQWGPWDAQRTGDKYHDEYVDYATFVIGLYIAAAGMPLDENLKIQNLYKLLTQIFPQENMRDPIYQRLLKENVENTKIGYDTFQSGRIKSHPE